MAIGLHVGVLTADAQFSDGAVRRRDDIEGDLEVVDDHGARRLREHPAGRGPGRDQVDGEHEVGSPDGGGVGDDPVPARGEARELGGPGSVVGELGVEVGVVDEVVRDDDEVHEPIVAVLEPGEGVPRGIDDGEGERLGHTGCDVGAVGVDAVPRARSTTEVNKNIIGERVLGLPKEPS